MVLWLYTRTTYDVYHAAGNTTSASSRWRAIYEVRYRVMFGDRVVLGTYVFKILVVYVWRVL